MSWTAVVLNDSSGNGDCAESARRVQELLTAAGREVRVTIARGGQELKGAMEQAVKAGCATLVAGGGDGTISTAASALVDRDIPLGVLPLGTLNHFAKDLGIPLELDDAVQIILSGTKCQVDVGEVNGHLFLNNSSLGVYPAIVRLRERYQAGGWGKWIAALWAALAVLRRNPFMAVRIKTETESMVRRTPFVFVGNNEYRMSGLHAGSRESLVGGKLATYVLNADKRGGLVRLGWQVLIKGVEQVKELDLLTVEEAIVETRRRRVPVALDGEVEWLESPMTYRTRQASLTVYAPNGASACHPDPTGPSSSH